VVLQDYGLTIDEASNGREGLEMATATDYDIILMDVQMPEMDGFTATRLLRQRGLTTPIVGLTANAMKGFEQELLEAGYSDYLTKPIDIDRFVSKLAQLLDAQPKYKTAPTSVMPATLPDHEFGTEETAPIVSKLGKNNPRFAQVISRFVNRLGEQLQAMDVGYANQDVEALAKLGHWLKGAGGTVGFDVFNQPAGKLEAAAKANDLEAVGHHLQHIHQLATRIALDEQHTPAGQLEVQTSLKPVG
jgi:CheY-like chemotaxis protein/HPt (histidine-containing phosphotransfer) domain-containing protein